MTTKKKEKQNVQKTTKLFWTASSGNDFAAVASKITRGFSRLKVSSFVYILSLFLPVHHFAFFFFVSRFAVERASISDIYYSMSTPTFRTETIRWNRKEKLDMF